MPNDDLLKKFVRIPVQFSSKLVTEVDIASLPDDWNCYPASSITKLISDKWARDHHSVVLKVLSVIIPGEFNYLINPLHSDFKTLLFGHPTVYYLNPRLKKT